MVYFDEAGFAASPPIQYGWGPRGTPHLINPKPHTRRSVLGALDYPANTLFHQVVEGSVNREIVVEFLEQVAQQCDDRWTIVVLDNASVHKKIPHEILQRWLLEHKMVLFYLSPYSPELNLIEIVWKHAKYHARKLVTWANDKATEEIDSLLNSYGEVFAVDFS